MRLKGKVSIITGGASGIGLATAEKFAKEGAIVVICDINEGVLDTAMTELKRLTSDCYTYVVNVTDNASIEAMVKDVHAKFGRIDVLINNAGIVMDAQLHKMDEDRFDKVIDVNLKGVFLCTKAVINIMREQGSGAIVNASSIVGLYGNFGQTNYAASKWGVIGMTKTWAKENGKKGIRVNAVCPGFVKTPIISSVPEEVLQKLAGQSAMGRLGEPAEIANVYAFLASDEASYINGAFIDVSGLTLC